MSVGKVDLSSFRARVIEFEFRFESETFIARMNFTTEHPEWSVSPGFGMSESQLVKMQAIFDHLNAHIHISKHIHIDEEQTDGRN